MSALTLAQTITALSPGLTASFGASGGTAPYAYSVRPNGAGGTINSSTGLYTAPAAMGQTPQTLYDTIQVADSLGALAYATILVGSALILFCDIIQTQLGLNQAHCYLWDQKIMQPTDSGLYVAVSVPMCKPYANNSAPDGSGGGLNNIQYLNLQATVDVDIISRGPAARDQKEFVVLALLSNYSIQQQEINSFSIGRITPNFVNLSGIDGAAIPYRYKISCKLLYAVNSSQAIPYFNTYSQPTVYTNP